MHCQSHAISINVFVLCVKKELLFYVQWSVHRESMSVTVQQDATIYGLLYAKFTEM